MDERSHLLHEHTPEVDDEGIVAYVQQRRASIASAGPASIPAVFQLSSKQSRESFADIHRTVSHVSHYDSVNELLSVHSGHLLEEPHTSLFMEIRALLKYSVPLVVTFLLQYSLTVASVLSVGRLGPSELAAVSLSSMTANISGYAIIQGVSTCLDTLCAQAHGRKDFNTVGMHFVRCTYLLMLCFVPMFVLWVFLSQPLLLMLVGEKKRHLVALASRYLRILSFGLPGFIIFENLKHFLQSQGIFHASTFVLIFCAPMNAVLNYVLVWNKHIGLGFEGAPLSVVITNWVMCLALWCYTKYVNGYACLPRQGVFHKSYFTNWRRMINLSIPGVLMVEAEWLAFEIITFVAFTFGTEVSAAQSIVSTTCVLLYQIPFALSITASTRIAWFIGAASESSALVATRAALYAAVCLGLVNATILFFFREFFASLFTNDKYVIRIASKVLIVGALYQINDFISCTTGGILRGQGRQKIAGYLNVISYYLIALPSALFFAFHFKLELLGLWLGMIIALFFVSVSQLYFVATSDWDHIIKECIEEGVAEDGVLNIEATSSVPAMSSSHLV
ncbi:hypothetical_protein [Candidozyma auris]|uniref:hypothetical_protein n=1 Tax=Candidozyma auris TaxID=498019 RepID=UPI000D2924D9|nr:hypothetical_protein [[Candida] auris]QEO22853.1 hypothetical_protein [[Candida] auris]GBL48904.1 putative MATE efflux family protein [[Candida] auris]